MDTKSKLQGVRTISPSLWFKGMAILLLYVFLAHPSVYITIWERRNWYVILCGLVSIPILLPWCVQVLVWRVRIDSFAIEIRSLRGIIKRKLTDIVRLERTYGRIVVVFADGAQRAIPSIVGNLDELLGEIESRRGDV